VGPFDARTFLGIFDAGQLAPRLLLELAHRAIERFGRLRTAGRAVSFRLGRDALALAHRGLLGGSE
jgi:hypothetical protein